MNKNKNPAPRANAGNRANSKVEQHQKADATRTSWGAR
jgi:hypothetical protein